MFVGVSNFTECISCAVNALSLGVYSTPISTAQTPGATYSRAKGIMKVAVVYYSDADTTRQLAVAIRAGVVSGGGECQLLRITGDHIIKGVFQNEALLYELDNADALIFGSPTYMGGPAAQFKAFADATSDRWDLQSWQNKWAAGFTVGANSGGDQLCTLQYFSILAAQHAMLWINLKPQSADPAIINRQLGMQLGFAGWVPGNTISPQDTEAAHQLGLRVISVCRQST